MFSTLQRSLRCAVRSQAHLGCRNKAIHTAVTLNKPPSAGDGNPKIAVVLSGCGVYDGSEVHESSAVLVHLSRQGADISMFAPDVEQMHAINHTKGEPMEHNRNVLVESARIARGNIEPLSNLQATNFDAVIFPGGFGAAKNLCNFAVEGAMMKVLPDVERVIKDFHGNSKPIGVLVHLSRQGADISMFSPDVEQMHAIISDIYQRLCCIAPVLAASVISGCEVTVGQDKDEDGKWPYAGTAEAVETMGAKHVVKNVTESHTDASNKLVTSPAFMYEGQFHEIFDGVGELVKNVLKLLK